VKASLDGVTRLRAIDVARDAGISVQQVRNYEALGVLPPFRRTAGNYRIFTAEHVAAVRVVRLLSDGHGWERTRTIMRALHAGDVETALSTVDSSHAELDRERAEIARVLGAFAAVTAPPPPPPSKAARYRIGTVADAVGARTSSLRLWERRGLLRPARERGTGYRVYDEAELHRARVVALLRRGNYPIAIVRAVVDEMRTTGSPDRLRAELARREQDLHRRSRLRLRASAALYDYLTGRSR
jgi:DNA-binding transcriptional MerR regulator